MNVNHFSNTRAFVSKLFGHFTIKRSNRARRFTTLLILCPGFCLQSLASIETVPEGYLFTQTGSSVLVSGTNGSILAVSNTDGDQIASGGNAGLWAVDWTNNTASTYGTIFASSFSSSSPSNVFSAMLNPASNVLWLTYSNADIVVSVTMSNRTDGVDISAAITPATNTVIHLRLPAQLRFNPAGLDRFIAPNHSSDGVGLALTHRFFEEQDEDSPATWREELVGAGPYISLYGGPLDFLGDNSDKEITFTTNGVAWLGADVSNAWEDATAIVNRPPAAGQYDIVLIDSTNGPYFSGSKLGGSGGYLLRLSGQVNASRVAFSRDIITAAIEHLAQVTSNRTKVAMLSMVRGPVIGESWPSEVRLDQWLASLNGSDILTSNGYEIVELTNIPEMFAAMADTNYLAILNPYGELLPASLSEGIYATVSNIGEYVLSGGNWFETAGHPFFFNLEPELYYTNSTFYPPLFADFQQLETTNGHLALYGVQPVPADPWAGATNASELFIPGKLVWGGDADGGYFRRAFATYVDSGTSWQSPRARLSLGRTASEALSDYSDANDYYRTLDQKMDAPTLDIFKQTVMIHYKGDATNMIARMPELPSHSLLHFEEYLYGGFDKEYPDHLPPNPDFGTEEEFTNFLAAAKAAGHLTMPYTNPTFWGVDPKGPTFLATNDAPLLINPDGSINLEAYFGEEGFTVTPWQDGVQKANRNTRNQFITNFPIDFIFHDQLGARTWQYDLNPASPTPYAYISGIIGVGAEDSQFKALSTENGYDRLINHESQFAGLAWGLAPTTNAPFWRRYLRDRYATDTWNVFPLAQELAHDKVSFTYNNLDASVHNHEVLAWTLGLGYGTTYVITPEGLDNVSRRQWLLWINQVQESVMSRYVGQPVNAFDHQWRTNALPFDNGIMTATYGPVEVIGNLGPLELTTNGWTLAPNGYLATATGLRAGYIMPPDGAGPVAYIAETNASGGLDFYIHSVGDTNATIVVPPGFNGNVILELAGDDVIETQVVANAINIALGTAATGDAYLWSGTITPAAQTRTILIDFGRHDSGTNGNTTASPDSNGNYWNNIGPVTQIVTNGTKLTDMIDTENSATGFDIEMITSGWEANGIVNGGLLAPSASLLGDLAITNATQDYFFTTVSPTLRMSGLNTNATYDLTFFGTRQTTATRISTYTVGTNSVNLQTSGTGIGDGGYDGNNDTTVTISNVSPNASGEIDVTLSVDTGGFAYLGIMRIDEKDMNAPSILVNPSSLAFSGTVGWPDPGEQSFGLTNTGTASLTYSVSTNAGWLSVSPSSGSLAPGAGEQLSVSVATADLQAGVSNALITITDPAANNSPQTVSVTLTISEPAVTVATQQVILVDLGSDASFAGSSVVNPDSNGNYWNSIWSGIFNANLIDWSNQATTVDIGFSSAYGTGNFNGPAGQVDSSALGPIGGDTNAVNDFYISSRFQIQSLDPGLTYRLTFFGSHKYSPNTTTVYSVYSDSNYVTLVGSANLDVQVPGSPALHNSNNVAVISDLTPPANGRFYIDFRGDSGSNGYLNAMMIEALDVTVEQPPAGIGTQAVVLVDLGRHDGSNGNATTSPDSNGHYWNNIGPTTESVPLGISISSMVNVSNENTGFTLETTTGDWRANGRLNGGLLAPSNTLLGNFAIGTATEDYFFTDGSETLRLSGLNPNNLYNLSFFGTRSLSSENRTTSYTVGTNSVSLQTSGAGIGTYSTNQNDNTIVTLSGLSPDPFGSIDIDVSKVSGAFAYLGVLQIEEVTQPTPSNGSASIVLNTASLSFTAKQDGIQPQAQEVGIANNGSGSFDFTIASDAAWLSATPASGTLAPGEFEYLDVSVNTTGLQFGVSNATLTITSAEATNAPQQILVSLTINTNPIFQIIGSSVSKGYSSSGYFNNVVTNGSWTNGYTFYITEYLTQNGSLYVTNSGLPGENTAGALTRFSSAVDPVKPDYLLIAYSLGNEGLSFSSEPASGAIYSNFMSRLQQLVGLAETNGAYPIISGVYPHGNYNLSHYEYVKRANLEINTWNVPSLNLLGVIDDGTGQWMDGYWADVAHPNDAGYFEFYSSFVPTLVAAIESGKTDSPQFGDPDAYARLTRDAGENAPVTFTPSNTIHSFTTAFKIRLTGTGTIAAVRSGADYATLEVRDTQLVYVTTSGQVIDTGVDLNDGAWHDVALASRYGLSNTWVYVNGAEVGSHAEQFVPDQFILGGPSASGRAATPDSSDLQSWCVYRSAWNTNEAAAQANGNLQQSSMEIGAMLDDASFTAGTVIANQAQSLSEAVLNTPNLTAESDAPSKLLVFGSSVAKGFHGPGSPGYTNGSYILGYAGILTPVLEAQGIFVTNASIGGNSTTSALARFDTDAVPVDPEMILIGLSLGNEGILGDRDAALASYTAGMTNLIHRSRTNGFYPIVTLNYANDAYDSGDYAYVQQMNLIMNSWDVPSINLLGALDDGTGGWPAGYVNDPAHPNPAGHEELFYSIVPSLFSSILNGKTNSPQFGPSTNFARLAASGGVDAPLSYTPSNTIHSFTTSFRLRTMDTGTVAAIRAGANFATLELRSTQLVYIATNGAETIIPVQLNDGAWHDIAIAGRYAISNTLIYIDGAEVTVITERFVPDQFVLGGPAGSGRAATPGSVDLQNWCVYRSAWNEVEADAQANGQLQQASMEIGAMLAETNFSFGTTADNAAQSESEAVINTANLMAMQGGVLAAPSNVTANATTGRSVNVSWAWSGSGQAGFVIQRRLTGSGIWSDIGTVGPSATNFVDSGLIWGQAYDYQVAAFEAGGYRGDYSEAVLALVDDGSHPTVLIDLGPDDVTNGDATVSPDWLGQYWNNLIGAGGGGPVSALTLDNLVTRKNDATGIGLRSGGNWAANGKLNGGLFTPEYGLLGNIAVTNVTVDYFTTTTSGSITITNLDSAANYRLRLFGTRNTSETRETRYVATGGNGSFTNTLVTSGTGIGSSGGNANDDTLALIEGITPDGSGEIEIVVNVATGTFAYLGALEITRNDDPVADDDMYDRSENSPVTLYDFQLLSNDSDPNNDTVSFNGFSSLPPGATTNANSITLPGTNDTVVFSYSITDGFGGSATATVTVNIYIPPEAAMGGVAVEGSDIRISWTGTGGTTNQVQVSTGDAAGGFNESFIDLGSPIVLPGSGDYTTNYLDVSGATNEPGRYYRIQLDL